MSKHMFLMSFNGNLINLFTTLSRFFEYIIVMLHEKHEIHFCYIGTAAKDRWLDHFVFSTFMRIKFGKRIRFSKFELTSGMNERDIAIHLAKYDILFVGGGNTEHMLKIWECSGFTNALTTLKNNNQLPILAGVSAGGMYMFQYGLSDCSPGQYKALKCLAWLKQSFCPHSNSKIAARCEYAQNQHLERMNAFQTAIQLGHIPEGFAVPDDCMLHFYEDNLIKSCSSMLANQCFYVSANSTQPIETIHLTKDNTHKVANDVLFHIKSKYK